MQPRTVIRNWHVSTFCVFVAYSFFCAILFSCVILIGYCWQSEIKVVIDSHPARGHPKKSPISLGNPSRAINFDHILIPGQHFDNGTNLIPFAGVMPSLILDKDADPHYKTLNERVCCANKASLRPALKRRASSFACQASRHVRQM